jgi:hypothetical protein
VAESVTGSGTGSWTGSGATLGTRPPTPPATCCATPLAPLFALAGPEGVYLSAVGMPISPPLLCAWRAPAKILSNPEISKNLSRAPLYV